MLKYKREKCSSEFCAEAKVKQWQYEKSTNAPKEKYGEIENKKKP